jgi:hypothetical protein
MAKLTDQLSTDLSVKPVREPPAPSTGLATLFNNVGDAIGVFDRVNRENAEENKQKAAAARQAKEDAYKETERKLPYEVLLASEAAVKAHKDSYKVFGEPTAPLTPEQEQFNKEFDATFSKLSSQKAAVQQGKLPTISLSAAMNRTYLELVNRFPDHVEKINEEFKKNGFQPSMALQAGADMQKVRDSERDSELKWQDDMYQKGHAALDPAISATMSREEIIAHGAAAANADYRLELASKQANLALTNKNISAAERDSVEKDRDENITQTLVVDAYNNSNPIIKALQETMISISKAPLPEQKTRWEQLGPQYDAWAANYKAQALARAAALGMTNTTTLVSQIDQLVTRGRSMFAGEMSVASANFRALQSLQTSAKVDAAKAMPVFFALQQAGIKASDIESFSAGIAANPKLQEALKREVSGYSTEFGEERASTHMMNIVRILKGENTIAEYTPAQARDILPTLYTTAKESSRKYVEGQDVDPKTVLNSTGAVISAARTLTPSSGLSAWTTAAVGVAGQNVRKALIKASKDPAVNDLAEANIQGARAVSAQLLDNMRGQFSVLGQGRFDQWKPVLKDGRAVLERKQIPLGGYVNGKVKEGFGTQPPSQELKQFVDTWNMSLDNIIALNAYDPTAVKNAKPIEIQRFYGANQTTGAFVSRPDINPNKEIDANFKALEDAFSQTPDMNVNVDIVDNVGGAEGMGKDSRSSALAGFIDSTWLSLMKKHEPGLTKDKTEPEILAMRTNKQLRDRMIRAYANENAMVLNDKGIPATTGNLNLMHLFGPGEGPKVLKADPNTSIEELVSKKTLNANPWMRGKTVNEIRKIRRA